MIPIKEILVFLRLILCRPEVIKWLREEAKKSTTPIDDIAVSIIVKLLCGSTEEE